MEVLKISKGGAALQLSWITNSNSWALTLFFKLNALSFGSKEF